MADMDVLCGVMAGIVVGVLAGVPSVVALRRAVPSLALGIAGVVTSFAVLTAAMLLVRWAARRLLLPFSVPAVLAFLVLVVLCALRSGH